LTINYYDRGSADLSNEKGQQEEDACRTAGFPYFPPPLNAAKNHVYRRDAEGTESINYIFLLRGQKYINCHDGLFFVFRPLTEKQN
jgi:hypothetical protein